MTPLKIINNRIRIYISSIIYILLKFMAQLTLFNFFLHLCTIKSPIKSALSVEKVTVTTHLKSVKV
jgi:hypothetical protein